MVMTFPVKVRLEIYNTYSGLLKRGFGVFEYITVFYNILLEKIEMMFIKVWKTNLKNSDRNWKSTK